MSFEEFLQNSWGIDPSQIDSLDPELLRMVMGQYEQVAASQGFDPNEVNGGNGTGSNIGGYDPISPDSNESTDPFANFDFGSPSVDENPLNGEPPNVPPSGSPNEPTSEPSSGPPADNQSGNNYPSIGQRPGAGYRPSQPFYDIRTANPQQMGEQDRLGAWSWLHGMTQGLQDDQDYYRSQEDFYNDALMGPNGYGGILNGRVGYDSEQAGNILQQGQIQASLPTDGELDDLALRDYDYASIPGDPWSTRDAYGGFMDQLWQIGADADSNQRGVAQAYGTNLDNTIDPTALSVDPNYGANRAGVIDAYGQFLQDSGAYGGNARVDPVYAGEQVANADEYAETLGSFDPNRFGLSGEFQDRYDFGPEDEQRMVNQASRDAGAQYRATADRVIRSASNTSNATPLAIAAALQNLDYESSRAGADAATDARIRAKQLGLSTTANRENMRLGSEQRIADQLGRASGQIAEFRRGTMADIEDRRQAGEQFVAGRAGALGQDLYNQYGDLVRDNENRRLDSNRDIANRRFEAADRGGRAVMDTESQLGNRNVSLGQYNVNTMGGATERAENTAAQRARDLAQMRMSGSANRINARYQTGMGAADRMRSGYQTVYGAQRQDQQEGRGFLAGRSQDLANTGRAITQQRIGSAGTGFGAANAGTSAVINGRQPALWERLLNAGVGAAAGAIAGGG